MTFMHQWSWLQLDVEPAHANTFGSCVRIKNFAHPMPVYSRSIEDNKEGNKILLLYQNVIINLSKINF